MKAIIFIIFSYVPAAVSQAIIGSAQCRYIRNPIYIKTKGCGGFCSGVIQCIQSDIYYPLLFSAGCQSEGDGKCPTADKCYRSKKPGKAFFIGNPDDYEKKYKEKKPEHQRTTGSGAIR